MKRYKVYVYNTVDKFWDCYEVHAIDPVDGPERGSAAVDRRDRSRSGCLRSSRRVRDQRLRRTEQCLIKNL